MKDPCIWLASLCYLLLRLLPILCSPPFSQFVLWAWMSCLLGRRWHFEQVYLVGQISSTSRIVDDYFQVHCESYTELVLAFCMYFLVCTGCVVECQNIWHWTEPHIFFFCFRRGTFLSRRFYGYTVTADYCFNLLLRAPKIRMHSLAAAAKGLCTIIY